jgi:hypothetical protein
MTDRAPAIPRLWNIDLSPNRSCLNCRHLHRATLTTCAAFPDGIPLPIQAGILPHDVPQPGDHGIQWQAAEDAPLGLPRHEAELAEILLKDQR